MHLLFKHLAIRSWLTILTGVPVAFYVIPGLGTGGAKAFPAMLYSLIIVLCFLVWGSLMHWAGHQLIRNAIVAATRWEQQNRMKNSEQALLRALTIYNTALLPPWRSRSTFQKLSGAMARFSLTHDHSLPVFYNATTAFLKKYPGEAQIARQWLEKGLHAAPEHFMAAQVLTLLAREHRNNEEMLPLLARRLMENRRNDFDAQIIYSNCLDRKLLSPETATEIATIQGTVPPDETPDT